LFKKDVHWYLRSLEEVVLDVLARFGIAAGRLDGLTGVWAGNAKIASIGIGIRHWVTWHGVSIVVHKEDLDNFSLIRPCGMDIRVTSMETLLQRPVSMQAVKSTFVESFGKVFVPVFE
jgi:lipoate-protein ligase B